MEEKLPEFYTLGPLPEIPLGLFSLPSYYFVISLGYCICILWFYKRCEKRKLDQQQAMDIGLIILFAGFIGARLFHIFFELPSHYMKNPIEVFYFWQGGFVFFGGFITAYLSALVYARKLKSNFWEWHDAIAPILAFGYGFGRIACFLVGCCYGKVCDLPWATTIKQVHIETSHIEEVLRHPTQLYATGLEWLFLIFLLWYEKRRPIAGRVFLAWLTLHSIGRIFMESLRDDPRGSQFFGLSISTLISILLLLLSAYLFFNRSDKKGNS